MSEEFTTQFCRICDIEKDLSHYYLRSDNQKLSTICRECHRKAVAKRKKEAPAYYRSAHLKKTYGITVDQYNNMFSLQSGLCAICFKKSKKRLSIDHHHASKKVRALLCNACNAFIGLAKEDIRILISAIRYLEKHGPSEPIENKGNHAISL